MGSSGESEKMIQRLNDELREAREIANTEKQKCIELQGNMLHTFQPFRFSVLSCLHIQQAPNMHLYFKGVLEEERKGHKQQAEQSSKQIKHLQGNFF